MDGTDMTVVWDGTKARGPYLAVDFDAPPAQADKQRSTTRARVVSVLLKGPHTIRAVTEAFGADNVTVGNAIGSLRLSGSVEIVGTEWGEHCGRDVSVYALTASGRLREASGQPTQERFA